MSTEIMVRYAIVFFLPTIYLYMLATFVYARSYHLKIAKLIAAFLLCGALGYTFDFVRVLAPLNQNYILHLFVTLPLVNLSFSIIIHMIYLLVSKVKKINIPFMPYILYSLPIIMIFYGLMETFIFETTQYYKSAGFVYRYDGSAISLNVVLALLFYILDIVLLFLGYKYSKSVRMKKFFSTCLIFTILLVSLMVIWNLNWINIDYFVPPTPGLLLILLTGTFFAFLIVRIDFIPSIVKRYASILATSPTPIIYLDVKKNIVEANQMAMNVFGFEKNKNFVEYFDLKNNQETIQKLFQQLEGQNYVNGFEVNFYDDTKEEKHILIDASIMTIEDETLYYLMVHDITIEYKQRKIKDYLAEHDQLTDVYNRSYFEKNVRQKLLELSHNNSQAAILLCDLNYFKEINDTYGHQVGDHVLVFAASLFKQLFPKPNIIARLGGDEFIVFFPNVPMKQKFLEQIEEVREQFKVKRYMDGNREIEVVPSFGIVFTKEDGYNYNFLYQYADIRMYENKKMLKDK